MNENPHKNPYPAAPASGRRRLWLKRAGAGSGALAIGGLALALRGGGADAASRQAIEAAEATALTGSTQAAAGHAAPAPAADSPFWFGFIGDTPYSRLEEGALRKVLESMSAEPLEFVLHVGDLKSSLESCDDALLSSRLELLGRCAHPLVLTPGDNEWTDCNRSLAPWQPGGRLERLDWLRARVYGRPQSLGLRKMALQQQAPYLDQSVDIVQAVGAAKRLRTIGPPRLPENLRWRIGSLQFCTLHVVGSNNAPRRSPELEQAWLLRQEANGAWLRDTAELAIRQKAQGLVKGLVIALHANMQFEDDRSDGWERMRQLVIAAARAFDGPVLLLHGDTHHFRSDRLLLRSHGLANFQRVECFGSPFSTSWVQIRWDPSLARPGAGSESDPFHVSTRSLP
jgi:hypothetical protein